MKRLLFILQILILGLSVVIVPKLYQEKIIDYRQEHPSNQVIEEAIVPLEGQFISIDLDKGQGVFIDKAHQRYLMRSLNEQTLDACLNQAFYGRLIYDQNQRQWNATKNEGVFDYDAYLFSEGYRGVYDVIDYIPSEKKAFHPILSLKYKLMRSVSSQESDSLNQTILAMFFKQKNQFEDYESYQDLGVLHLFAVSGLHFGVIYLLMSRVIAIPYPKIKRIILCLIMLAFYAFMGRSYSSFRAMTCIFYVECAKGLHRKVDFLSLFAFSHLLTLIFYPYAILSTAYLLSFYIYFMVAFIIPLLTSKPLKFKKLLGFISLQFLTLPVSLMLFNTLNILSFISNLILIPIYSGLLIVLVLYVLCLWLLPSLAALIHPLLNGVTTLIHHVVIRLPHYSLKGSFSASVFYKLIVILIVIIAVQYLFYLKDQYKLSLVLMTILLVSLSLLQPAYNGLCIDVIDVGHGDSALIRYEGKTILIDTGKSSAPTDDFLMAHGVNQIDYMILSHRHQDHIGSFGNIASIMPIKTVICMADTRDILLKENDNVDMSGIKWEIMDQSLIKTIQIGDLTLTMTATEDPKEANDNGVLTQITLNDFTGLFTGDYSIDNLNQVALPQTIDFYKMPHHGSKTSYNEAFFKAHPLKFISVSHHTQYHFPDKDLPFLLKKLGIPYASTFFDGQIHMELHGQELEIDNFFKHNLLIDVSDS